VGARVTRVDFEAWESAMHVLSLLEGYATALAAPLLTPDAIAELREINMTMNAALEASDIAAAKDANRQFHVRLYDACPNDHLMGLVRVGWDRLDALRGWDIYHLLLRGRNLVDEHEHLLTMIESGASPATIESYARDHKLRTVEVYRQNQGLFPTVPGVSY
jgi:DNA-binding GntR family transcriptional regulator